MKSKLTLLALVVCLLFCKDSFADTFIVTSNADNGAGTLREAIQKARDNGTSVTDTILFNLANLSRADRTIVLDSTLPLLSSYLIIDGTSQPGMPFGISDARIQVENKYSAFNIHTFTFFEAMSISNIQIYGLYLKGNDAAYAINFIGVNDLIFGSPGKGNIVNGFDRAFYSFHNSFSILPSNNISFQSNLLGIDESGDFVSNTTYNSIHFKFLDVFNLLIGGLGEGEGNLMCDDENAMDWHCSSAEDSGYLRIEGNKIGTDRTGLKRLISRSYGFSLNAYNDGVADPSGTSPIEVSIINNISAVKMSLFKFRNYFKIQGNRFGVGADNVTNIGENTNILYCPNGIIGGDASAEKNYIANSLYVNAIYLFMCGNIKISKNSFFCNLKGIDINWALPRPKPFISIIELTSTQVAGKSLPKSIIELFYDDVCPGCEGKIYIGSTTADANGRWSYNVNNTGGIVATATDTYGATSEFSTATINTNNVEVKDATCGRSNGAIRHLRIESGTEWYWENETGRIMARDTDLVNVPPGKYKFVSSIGGNSCKTESVVYEVKNIDQPSIDSSFISMQQPSCGLNNGALKSNVPFNDFFKYQWVNNANTVLLNDFSIQNPFINLFPADYYLKIHLRTDSTCFAKYGPFKLVNQSGPSLNTDGVKITNTTCDANNGSIKNIKYQNAIGTVYTTWEDSTGKTVGNNINLTEIGKGKYRLKFKDSGSCDTIVTPYYIVTDLGTIEVDTSLMIASPSSCRGPDGSITKIKSTNATIFTWSDMTSGNVVGNKEDIYGLKAGTYQLELNNSFGCSKLLRPVSVGHAAFLTNTIVDVAITDANCFLDNGAIKINRFTRDPSLYSFKWTSSLTNAIVSSNISIENLSAALYTLTATDTSGCSEVIFATKVPQIGKPGFNSHSLKIVGDTCNSGTGSIQNLLTRDSSRIDSLRSYIWTWYNTEQEEISSTPNNLFSLKQGTYYATITDQFKCTSVSNLFTITNEEIRPDKPEVKDEYIPRNTTTKIAVNNPKKGIYELLEDDLPGSQPLASSVHGIFQSPVISADRSFFIRFNKGDCASSLSKINIKVFDSTIIYVPNAFTPNNDYLNDAFRVVVQGKLKSFHISVYNRFGNAVYSSNDIKGQWDGTVKGTPAPAGIFIYTITGLSYENRTIRQKGVVTLIR